MKFLTLFLGLFFSIHALSHSGGTNAQGCHHDHKNGGYHCHKSPATEPRTVSSEQNESTVYFNVKSKKYHRPACSAARACTRNCITVEKSKVSEMGGVPCGLCGG